MEQRPHCMRISREATAHATRWWCAFVGTQREPKQPSIFQMGRFRAHLGTEGCQVPIQLAIIERAQFHLDGVRSKDNLTWQPEEGRQPVPGGVGIGGGEIPIPYPHYLWVGGCAHPSSPYADANTSPGWGTEAHLIALSCSPSPQGQARWTLRLLASRMVELGYVGQVSYETVRRTLKKTRLLSLVEAVLVHSPACQRAVCLAQGRCARSLHPSV